MSSRREFLKISALASTATLLPRFLQAGRFNLDKANGRKLVVIQLSGGNDGLNTVVPFGDDIYYQQRAGIGIAPNQLIQLDDHQGFNPALEALRPLYDDGQLSLLNSVGYPNPNRSHFRAMDIWHTGSNADEYWENGWLGRYLDHQCLGQAASPHSVVEIDDTLSLSVKGKQTKGLAVRDPKRLFQATQAPYLQHLDERYQSSAPSENTELHYLYKTMAETMQSAEYIYEKSKIYQSKAEYPGTELGRRLKLIAELICSGVDTTVFYVSLSGFDTHVRQRSVQDRLLRQYAEAVAAFTKDLQQNQRFDDTMIMTFSEFGRRVSQNASGGTDHGKANNLFLMGGKLQRPGIFNKAPDLSQLDEGDVQWEIDFRQVYATLLDDWLGVADEAILQRKFKKLRLV